MPSDTTALSDADLHGLVDGRLETERQAGLLQRVKLLPADRARIDSWREQNDLLRASFSDVENEPLPVSLNLAPAPRLRCVANDENQTSLQWTTLPATISEKRRNRSRLMALVAIVAVFGLLCVALFHLYGGQSIRASLSTANPSLDDRLAERAVDAITAPASASGSRRDLPTLAIPDLTIAGFSFLNATVPASEPPTLIFTYENDAAERLVVAVSRTPRAAPAKREMPVQVGRAVVWHAQDKVFVVAGSVEARRLSAIALDLQTNQSLMDQAE